MFRSDLVPKTSRNPAPRQSFSFRHAFRENVMAIATQNQTLDRRETASLIGSDKVEGTPVYRSNGDRVGQIERVMIDKLNGKVAYAVMSFGGFLGIGEDYYPLPWSLLDLQPATRGLRGQCGRAAAQGCAEIFQARELGLVRSRPRQAGLRLLRRRSLLGLSRDRNRWRPLQPPATAGGFFMHPQHDLPGALQSPWNLDLFVTFRASRCVAPLTRELI